MIQGIRNNLAYPFSRANSAGSTVSTRRIEKFELRLEQTERSNRALLDELMRMQTLMKVTSTRHQQRLEEEKQGRHQLDQALRSTMARLIEAEERARRAELTSAETKAALTQLVTHTKNVERAVSNSQQGLEARKDASSHKMEQLEKNLRNEIQELKTKLGQQAILAGSLSKPNSDVNMIELRSSVQELQNKLKNDEKSREVLQQRNIHDMENNLTKSSQDVLQRMTKLETTIAEIDEHVKKTSSEMEKILAVEILARRDQGKLLKSKIYECNDNLRVGLTTVQGKKLSRGLSNDVNWKLDALKVHQISEEAAEQVKQDLEKKIQELQKKQQILEDSVHEGQGKTNAKLSKKDDITKVSNLMEKSETEDIPTEISKKGPVIVGGQLDQSLDEILFGQEKLKWQISQLRDELDTLKSGQRSGKLEERLTLMERRLTARMDAESRNTNKNVIILKDDIDLLNKRVNPEIRSPGDGGNETEKKPVEKQDQKALIVGSETDQRLDEIYFMQEKLRHQNVQMQEDLDKLKSGSKTGSLEDRVTELDRRMTARMDAETRNRNNDVKLLKEDVELLKKRDAALVTKQQNAVSEDVKTLKKDLADTKTGFRKLAESVQVVKTTLGDKLNEETKIRKQETGRLQTDVTKIKTWMQKNS